MALAVVVATGLVAVAAMTASTARASDEPEYQLSLGDSLATGWGASVPSADYANLLVNHESTMVPGLTIENLSCPAETTTTLLEGGGWCSYEGGSQLAAAEAFLRAHPGQVRYITIDIGINDVAGCAIGPAVDPSCVEQGVAAVGRNLPQIIAGIETAAPGVAIFGANSYDPFLAGAPSLSTPHDDPYLGSADLDPGFAASSLEMVDSLDATVDGIYQTSAVSLVDVAEAFDSNDESMTGTFDAQVLPKNVSAVCAWTHMCDSSGWTIHLNDAGYAVVAQAFEAVIGPHPASVGSGTWLADAAGDVHPLGGAAFLGDLSGQTLNRPIVGMAATSDGGGYWLVASDGGVFTFGDAAFYGSTGSIRLNRPIIGILGVRNGNGYSLVAADGGMFAFGSTPFVGSLGSSPPPLPVIAAASS